MCAYSENEVGCFRSSKGFSQATPDLRSFSPPDFAPIRRHPQQPSGSKRMLAVCRAGSKVTEVLAQYASLSHRPSMTIRLRTDQAAIEATVLRVNLSFTGCPRFCLQPR